MFFRAFLSKNKNVVESWEGEGEREIKVRKVVEFIFNSLYVCSRTISHFKHRSNNMLRLHLRWTGWWGVGAEIRQQWRREGITRKLWWCHLISLLSDFSKHYRLQNRREKRDFVNHWMLMTTRKNVQMIKFKQIFLSSLFITKVIFSSLLKTHKIFRGRNLLLRLTEDSAGEPLCNIYDSKVGIVAVCELSKHSTQNSWCGGWNNESWTTWSESIWYIENNDCATNLRYDTEWHSLTRKRDDFHFVVI